MTTEALITARPPVHQRAPQELEEGVGVPSSAPCCWFRHPGLGRAHPFLFRQVAHVRMLSRRQVERVRMLSHVQLFATPRTVACQAPLSMGFCRQECWSGLPFPSPGDLADPGIKPTSLALQADSLPHEPPGKLPMSMYDPCRNQWWATVHGSQLPVCHYDLRFQDRKRDLQK